MKFPCMEVAKFADRDRTFWYVLPVALRCSFSDAAPCKGLRCPPQKQQTWVHFPAFPCGDFSWLSRTSDLGIPVATLAGSWR